MSFFKTFKVCILSFWVERELRTHTRARYTMIAFRLGKGHNIPLLIYNRNHHLIKEIKKIHSSKLLRSNLHDAMNMMVLYSLFPVISMMVRRKKRR